MTFKKCGTINLVIGTTDANRNVGVGFFKPMSKKWIQGAVAKMKQKGTVGSFSAAAKAHGKSTMAYAHQVASSPNASTTMKRKAQFALNVNK